MHSLYSATIVKFSVPIFVPWHAHAVNSIMFVIHRSVGRSTDRLALLFLVKMRTTRVDHRVHGDRVMHESIVGRDPMIGESRIQLYKHSARWPTAMEMFLRCNHPYRSFAWWPRIIGISYDPVLIWISTMLRSLLFVGHSILLLVMLIIDSTLVYIQKMSYVQYTFVWSCSLIEMWNER